MIKAIDTFYAGHLFRSRLEARWAVYFDEFGVSWEYEKEGYELGGGERYLPDFYIPKYGFFAEIKPQAFTEEEHNKCFRLAELTGKNVIELVGLPSVNSMNLNMPHENRICTKCGKPSEYTDWEDFDDESRGIIVKCGCGAKVMTTIKVEYVEAILLLYCPKESFKPFYYSVYMDDYTRDDIIDEAIIKAKCARFEFNKK